MNLAPAAAPGLIGSSEKQGAARRCSTRNLMMAVAAVAAGAVLLVGVVWAVQRRVIYFPLQQGVPPVATALPGATEVNFETDDGLRLGGWFQAAAGGESSATMPGPPARTLPAGVMLIPTASCTSASRWEPPWRWR